MKTKDFDRLKAICEQEGLYFDFDPISTTAVVAKLKDPWEGVEFAEITEDSNKYITKGKIYPIKDMALLNFRIKNDVGEDGGIIFKTSAKPSTEADYIEQLKEQAFERFGEIKEGDRFENVDGEIESRSKKAVWHYFKDADILYYGMITVYKQGKWATKIESIEVEFNTSCGHETRENNSTWKYKFEFTIKNKPEENLHQYGKYLAQQLEKHLNNENTKI